MGDIDSYISSLLTSVKVNEYGIAEYLLAIFFSLLIGVICMFLYRAYYSTDYERNDSLAKSFIIIAPSITAVFYAIQYSLPLSLGLLGALSFVRFRTPIKKPEDIGFILLVIALSLLTAVFRFMAAGILISIIIAYVFWKNFVVDKKKGLFRQGEFFTVFISTNNMDVNVVDTEVADLIHDEFGQKAKDKAILDDVTRNGDSFNMRYLIYLNRAEDQSIPRLITVMSKSNNIQHVEVFRGRAI